MRQHHLRLHRGLVIAVAVAAGLTAGACADDETPGDGGGASDAPEDTMVTVDDNVFEPETVEIESGTTVVWEWVGSETHNVKADEFESDLQVEGTFEHTFDDPGSFPYVCTVHPGMEGTVEVSD